MKNYVIPGNELKSLAVAIKTEFMFRQTKCPHLENLLRLERV